MVRFGSKGRRVHAATTVGILAVAAASAIVLRRYSAEPGLSYAESGTRRQVTGPITVVLTGDTMMIQPIRPDDRLSEVASIISESSVAITNLEATFFEKSKAPEGAGDGSHVWPFDSPGLAQGRSFGNARAAEQLRQMGFSIVSCANNHAVDFGADGLRASTAVLDRVGLHHAGCGNDLDSARAPVRIGERPRRVSLISLTTSSAPETRATRRQGDILGRSGVNPLRYALDVTADPDTFETLRRSPAAQQATPTHITVSAPPQ